MSFGTWRVVSEWYIGCVGWGWSCLTAVELGVREEADVMLAISRLDMVSLEMERYVIECYGITVNIQGAYCC
jgi:hypothetical protein